MKKRLLSFLLLIVTVAASLPLSVLPTLSAGAQETGEMTEADYNALYVQDGLVYSMDFFALNEYWSPEGHGYAIPVGPSDNTAYYDADTKKTFDFTVENNRFTYTVTRTLNGTVTTEGTYLGEAEAMAAVNEKSATDTEGATYAAVKGDTLHAAWGRAVSAWLSADKLFFRNFENYAAIVNNRALYLSSANNSFATATGANRHRFVRTAIDTLGNGSVTLLPSGKTFTSGGGLQLVNAPAGLGTMEVVSVLGESLSSVGGYFLFNNIGLVPTKNAADGTYTIWAGLSDRAVKLDTVKSAAAFPYNTLTTLTYTMADGSMKVYQGADTVLDATYTGTVGDTNYLGWAGRSYDTELYAVRYYTDVLTEAERAQNHFADVAKYFRLDVREFLAKKSYLSADTVTAFYKAFASVDLTSTLAAAETALAAAIAALAYPTTTEAEYNALYVQDGLLFQFDFFPLNEYWDKASEHGTIEVADTAAATVRSLYTWLNSFLVVRDSSISFREQYDAAKEYKDADGTYSPHIPFLIKDGYVQFKQPEASVGAQPPYFQLHFSSTYTPGESGFTMESQISYDDVTPGVKAHTWLPWTFALNPKITLDSTSAFTITGSRIWSDSYTLASTPTVTHNGKPFSLAYTIKTGEASSSANILVNGESITTGTLAKADSGTDCNIGYYYGSYGMKLYGVRLYDRVLSAEEMSKNHFADIAKFFRLDIGELTKYAEICTAEDVAAYYDAFAAVTFASTREEAVAVAKQAMAALKATLSGAHNEAYYNALYATDGLLLQLDFFPLNEYWGKASEYGTLTAAESSGATKTAVVTWLRQFLVANPGSITIAVNGSTGDSGATTFDHQIPFFIKDGYIQYKSFSDGYTVNNNNPYLQFIPTSTDIYNVGGFTWESVTSFDSLTKSGALRLPALSDVRPYITATTSAFTVTQADTGITLTGGGTLSHNGKAFTLTYRIDTKESGCETRLSADGTALGTFTKEGPLAGKVCDIGWNFNQSGAKLYAVRLYNRTLSDAELRQNHFADLAKFFRLELAGFEAYTTAERARFYDAFAAYDLRTATLTDLQKAYTTIADALAVEKYEAHYLEGDAYAAHNAFIDACIARVTLDRVSFLSIDAIYAIPLSERGAIYALKGEALTQEAINDAVAAYWSFDEEAYRSYDKLYYDNGDLIAAYDFFALNAYWNADRLAGYLPTGNTVAAWESATGAGGRYLDRFAVKGKLTLRHESDEAPFRLPGTEERGEGGFVLLGGLARAADGFSVTGLGSGAVTAEAVLRTDSATAALFSLSGVTLGASGGVYTAPGGLYALTESYGIGSAAALDGINSYTLTLDHGGLGGESILALSVNGTPTVLAKGAAMAAPSGTASLGLDQSFTGAVYAVRYYRTALGEAERAQNHFADIAKFYRLTLTDIDLIRSVPAAATALYAAFADLGFEESRETVVAAYEAFRADFIAEHPTLSALRDEAEGLLSLVGFQVRLAGTDSAAPMAYAGLRGAFTMDEALLAALEGRGYTVRLDVVTRNAEEGHIYRNNTFTVPLYDGVSIVGKRQEIADVGECFVITVVYASGEEGSRVPLSDERIAELIRFDVAYDYTVTLVKDGVGYAFTYQTTSARFGDTVNAAELYRYFGLEGDDLYQGSQKEDTLVKKMLSLIPPEEGAVTAPTVGRLPLAADGKANYTVTLPEGASEAERAAAEAFAERLGTLAGASFSVVSEAGVRQDREIVIALGSTRDDAAAFAADAATRGLAYAIGVSGERVLVFAADGAALSDALALLYAAVTDNSVGDKLGDNRNLFYLPADLAAEKAGDDTTEIGDLTLVLPAGMDADRRAIVNGYIATLATRTGITLTVADDSRTVAGRRILLATAADNAEAAEWLAATSYTGFAIAAVGDDILISAYTDVALRAALATLLATVSDEGALPTGVTLTADYGAGAGVAHLVTGGTLAGGQLYDAGSDSFTAAYTGVTEDEYLAYCDTLVADGFALLAENERNGCLFATYTAEGRAVILAYYPMLKKVTVTIQPEGTMLPNREAAPYEKDDAVTPSVTLMDHELASYVMQLEDGSFMIVDGGDLNRTGAMDKMWDHLTDLTPEGEKPVISLWLVTHGHSDHVILMTEFLKKYHNDLVLLSVGFNVPNYDVLDMAQEYASYSNAIAIDAWNLCDVLDRYYPDTVRWIPRTGQIHSVAGAEIEVLFSHEDYFPGRYAWGNDTSSAFRVTLGGTSIVYLGDCTGALCKQMATVFGETLESDILQVAHHGVGGGDLTLYQYIDPKICLFGTSIGEFTGDRCNGTGNYTAYDYNAWVRTTDWTRVVNGVEITGARTHYHGSVRTTIPLK